MDKNDFIHNAFFCYLKFAFKLYSQDSAVGTVFVELTPGLRKQAVLSDLDKLDFNFEIFEKLNDWFCCIHSQVICDYVLIQRVSCF